MALPKILALAMIITAMFSAVLQVERQHLIETLRQRGLSGRALLANFVLVPAFALGLVQMIHPDSGVGTGILLMAMAPGVPFIVRSAGRKFGGTPRVCLALTYSLRAF
jgi:predicted Na+-dependent transporter